MGRENEPAIALAGGARAMTTLPNQICTFADFDIPFHIAYNSIIGQLNIRGNGGEFQASHSMAP